MQIRRLNIRQLAEENPCGFRIAAYQRHYVWGQCSDGDKDSAEYLTQCLIESCKERTEYFLQGITVHDGHLVDGQQRITYLKLMLHELESPVDIHIAFDNRKEAALWLADIPNDISEDQAEESQDIYFYKHTLRTIRRLVEESGIENQTLLNHVLEKTEMLQIELPADTDVTAIYNMMNGVKAPMEASDIIKADLMRMAADERQPNAYGRNLSSLRWRYTGEWEAWVRWWNRPEVAAFFLKCKGTGVAMPLRLCLRSENDDLARPLSYEEFRLHLIGRQTESYHSSKHFFLRLRRVQLRFEEALESAVTYNRIQAIMLLQPEEQMYRFLHRYFVSATINAVELERYYKLSFLGMSFDQISRNDSPTEYFDDLLASLSMADVYHTEAKRDAFNLLLRLNIDEDIKLGRKFDFNVWNKRSLEHIYSKSKVWHTDESGKVLDGNDRDLRTSTRTISKDPSFMPRERIVNLDGTRLSEHCIGNLVLLYGENNARFGNANFEDKKMMFLTPGDMTVFESRNLLHSVCIFAGNRWDHQSIVDNYNLTLKNLKLYYGYK